MEISVSAALGWGPTALAAFDHALLKTGAANHNLIRLSSVIPSRAVVVEHEGKIPDLGGEWGDRLYVVYADHRTTTPGVEVWAGVGWVHEEQGQGLFVEHEGHSEQEVRTAITQSLKTLLKNRGMPELPITMKVIGGVCQDQPLCALVVAAFQTAAWNDQ